MLIAFTVVRTQPSLSAEVPESGIVTDHSVDAETDEPFGLVPLFDCEDVHHAAIGVRSLDDVALNGVNRCYDSFRVEFSLLGR